MKKIMQSMLTTAALTATCGYSAALQAEAGIDDPQRAEYYETLKGKRVAFVPVAMGFDLTEGWYAGMQASLEPLGVTLEVRDPNWSAEAGARALSSLIADKPDVIVVHNPDVQTYAKLLRKAERTGIRVVQINMKSAYSTDAFVGADWVQIGERAANAVVEQCGDGTSGKVAIVQGVVTAAASAYQLRGVDNIFSQHDNISVVSNQAADWDASKARSVTETTLQQHPDLCGIIGFWDGMDVGTGAAVKEAGKQDDIFVVTSGGGGKAGCDNLSDDVFDLNVSYDVPGQARDLSSVIKSLLQVDYKSGENEFSLYTSLMMLTKDNIEQYRKAGACWTVADLSGK